MHNKITDISNLISLRECIAKWPLFYEKQVPSAFVESYDCNFIEIFSVWVIKACLENVKVKKSFFLFYKSIDWFGRSFWEATFLFPYLFCTESWINTLKKINRGWLVARGIDMGTKFLDPFFRFSNMPNEHNL